MSAVALTTRTLALPGPGGRLLSVSTVAVSAPAGPSNMIEASMADTSVGVMVSSVAPGVAVAWTLSVCCPAAVCW